MGIFKTLKDKAVADGGGTHRMLDNLDEISVTSSQTNASVVGFENVNIGSISTSNRLHAINEPIINDCTINKITYRCQTIGTFTVWEVSPANVLIQSLGSITATATTLTTVTGLAYTVKKGNYIGVEMAGTKLYFNNAVVGRSFKQLNGIFSIGETLSETYEYTESALVFNCYSDDMDVLQKNLFDFSDKHIAICGDSISVLSTPRNWVYKLNQLVPSTYYNYAVSGADITHVGSTVADLSDTPAAANNKIWNQVNRIIDDYTNLLIEKPDTIIVEASTNDYAKSRTIGDVATAFANGTTVLDKAANTLLDMTTCIRFVNETIWQTFPECKIVWMSMYQLGVDQALAALTDANIYTYRQLMADYGTGVENACAYMGIKNIRLDNILNISAYLEKDANVKLYDAIHLNEVGSDELSVLASRKLVNYMK